MNWTGDSFLASPSALIVTDGLPYLLTVKSLL